MASLLQVSLHNQCVGAVLGKVIVVCTRIPAYRTPDGALQTYINIWYKHRS